ncbi:hypothetical protein F2Q69_00035737 [Brassica cretica]|uniref:Uncharacterized protein n=1 Tax=Brassica cretica TaxID=69181 RepID=A0A8S9SS94_BRACR|nr:hypothetical protein F2Q69_00035737 [Brassica cretica]
MVISNLDRRPGPGRTPVEQVWAGVSRPEKLILVLGLQYLYLNFLVTCITRFDYCLWKSLLNRIEKIMELKNLKKAGPQKPMFTVEWIDNALRGLRYQTGRHRLTCWPSLIEGMVNLVDMSIRTKIRV